jgi:DNA-binding NarL/FixJ family response regulator
MRRVVIDMQNALFADAIATALQKFDLDFEVCQSESPAKTTDICAFIQANILIMEVTAYTPWKLKERMRIRDEVKAQNPDCKIVLVVDENTEKKLADKVRQAKKDGLIDNFIYGSVSST